MSEPLRIDPGTLVDVACPQGSLPLVALDEVLLGEDKSPAAVVVKVEDAKVHLGPMRAGEFGFEVPCTQGQKISVALKITPLEKDQMPERAPPLGPLSLAYPLIFWVLIAFLVALLLSVVFWFIKKRRIKNAVQVSGTKTDVIDPEVAFKDWVLKIHRTKFIEETDPKEVLAKYLALYEKTRAFLDKKMNLQSSIDTTREFLVTFRAAGMKFKIPPDVLDKTEQLLRKCDDVRFAGEIPDPTLRRLHVQYAEDILKTFKSPGDAS